MGLAMLCGFLAGMAPDLDVLISSAEDPLLFLEYHRQFTHSLIFIPLGALLVAAALWLVIGRRRGWVFKRVYAYCLAGYATHALLDACTTYGTLLLWPFSDQRFAWNNISIIDPLFTLPILGLVIAARWKRRAWLARIAMFWAVSYLLLGIVARDAAVEAGYEVAASRGHQPELLSAKPSFANLLLWKTVYRESDTYYVDAVRLGSPAMIFVGESVKALDVARDFPDLDPNSVQAVDIGRFDWFSMGYLALDPSHEGRVMDLRYSMLPDEIAPLWGIQLDPSQPDAHVDYVTDRGGRDLAFSRLWAMLSDPEAAGAVSLSSL